MLKNKYLIILFVFLIASCDKEVVDNAESESTILFPSEGGVFLTGYTYTITWLDKKSTNEGYGRNSETKDTKVLHLHN